MKIAFKNFVMTLRRYKTASALNIAGLTLAFTAFYIIMAQVRYEVSFNRSIADNERVYLVSPQWNEDKWSTNAPRLSSERAIAASPDVEAGGCVKHGELLECVWVKRDDYNFEKFPIATYEITEPILDVMSFRAVAGDLHDVTEPDHVIVSRKTADLLGIGVGDDLYMPSTVSWLGALNPDVRVTVAGVFEDFAPNTLLSGMTIFCDAGDKDADSDSNWNFSIYVKLRDGADPASFAQVWENEYLAIRRDLNIKYEWGDTDEDLKKSVRLLSLRDMFYDKVTVFGGSVEQGSVATTVTLFGIAALIVLVAFINFVNFFFALIPVRLRGVNICKVFGASTATLRRSFVFEAVGLALCSLGLALYAIVVVQDTPLARYVTCSLAFADNLPVIGMSLAVVSAMAVAAALYPAWYITSFNVSLAAKGGFAGSASGRRLRTALVGVQFAISMTLIVAAMAFWLQYRFMVDYDLGFDSDNLLTFEVYNTISSKEDAFVAHLESNPDIDDATASGWLFFGVNSIWSRVIDGRNVNIYNWRVRPDFCRVMGIRIVEGEDFAESSRDRREMLVSRSLCHEGLKLGDEISGYTVVGVFDNVNPLSMAEKYENAGLALVSGGNLFQFYVRPRAGADIARVCDFIRKSVAEFDPKADEPTIEFFDAKVRHAYAKTKRQTVVVALFSLLSVGISLMGVFGVVLFETRHRRREIAVRRVFGASIGGTIWMLNRRYAAILVACFAIAAPSAAYLVGRWQESFATRAEIGWWIFAAAFVAVAVLTLGLVTLCSSRAANENPSRVLGGE